MTSDRIALFPLRTVLFPQGVLPLRIFETRYVDMVRRCLRENTGFGVVLIREGAEVGGVAAVEEVGTLGRIVDFGAQPDGLLRIVAHGERRFRLLAREQQRDGLHLGDVEWLDESTAKTGTADFPELLLLLERALAELGDAYPCGPLHLDDALWVSSQLGQVMPFPAEFRQQMLEMDDPRARLALLDAARRQRTH